MSQPDDWLEELLGFSQDGSRRVPLPCSAPLVPEGLGVPKNSFPAFSVNTKRLHITHQGCVYVYQCVYKGMSLLSDWIRF